MRAISLALVLVGMAQLQASPPSLHEAVAKGDADMVRALIEAGANVNAKDDYGYTPLHRAAGRSRVYIAGMLIEAGADVNASDIFGMTPLHEAAINGDAGDVASVLIEAGADVNAKDDYGKTPLHMAAERGHADMVRLLSMIEESQE